MIRYHTSYSVSVLPQAKRKYTCFGAVQFEIERQRVETSNGSDVGAKTRCFNLSSRAALLSCHLGILLPLCAKPLLYSKYLFFFFLEPLSFALLFLFYAITMATQVAPEPTNQKEEQLWKIIKKQRAVIQDLQKALAQVTADRDQLMNRHDRCDSLDDVMMSSTSSSSSSSTGPIPPPRSPFRQKDDVLPSRVDSLVVEKDVSARSSSLPTRPVSPISSPVNAILDKDAQQFARYQESQKSWKGSIRRKGDDAWHWPPPPPPPTKKTLRHVRRASSQPAISTAHKKNDDMENSLAGIDVKVLGSNITTNSKGKGVVSFTISVRKDMDDLTRELWRVEKLYSDFLQLDGKVTLIYRYSFHGN